MKILVTGATGAVGPRIVGALCECGYAVRTFSIDDPPSGSWPSGVEALKGDITDPGIKDFTHFRSNHFWVTLPPFFLISGNTSFE